MLEREVERHLVDTVKDSGGKAYKWTSPGTIGVPDRLVLLPPRRMAHLPGTPMIPGGWVTSLSGTPILPGGRICAVECKAPGKTLTAHQARTIAELRGFGLSVLVVDNCEEIDRLFGSI